MSYDLYTEYGITPPERNDAFIKAYNDALFHFVPPTPEEIERRRIATEEWGKKSQFEKEFSEHDGLIVIGSVFDVAISDDLLTAVVGERCDGAFECPMTKTEFQKLIDAMQNLCNKMKP